MASNSPRGRTTRDSILRPPLRERLNRTYLINAWAQALCLRRWRRPVKGRITLVSPDYTGNVGAFGEYLRAHHPRLEVLFLPHHTGTIGPTVPVTDRVVGSGVSVLKPTSLRDLMRVARSEAIVTAWGSGNLRPWLHRKHRPVFADAWHGVGFKAAMISQPGRFRRYDAIFAPSEHIAELYREARMNAVVTGYARMDRLLDSASEPTRRQQVRDQLITLPHGAFGTAEPRIVLYAPTWSGATDPSPWSSRALFEACNAHAQRYGYVLAVRPHPVAPDPDVTGLDRVVLASTAAFPSTEDLLSAADALITDWSSIATDYLALDRPVIYLDAPEPAGRMFPLGSDDRPGPLATTLDGLLTEIARAVSSPLDVVSSYHAQRQATLERSWGSTRDGNSAQRYLQGLLALGVLAEDT